MPIKGKILSTFPIEISVAAIGKNKNVFWSVCPSILIYRPLLFISGLFCSVSFCLFTFCFLVFGFFRHFRYWLLETVVRDKTSLFMDKWPQPIFGIGCSTFLIVCSRRGGSSATANDWEERKKPKRRGPAVVFVHSGVKRDHESDRPKDSLASVQLCTRNLRPGGLSRIRWQRSVTDC